jgi:hypothetical protein
VRWLVVGAVVWGLLAVPVVAGLMVTDRAQVTSHTQLHHAQLGRPVSWITQDASTLSPPMPYAVGLLSPWENPTDAHWWAFLVDIAIVWAAGMVVLGPLVWSGQRLARDRAAHAPGAAAS